MKATCLVAAAVLSAAVSAHAQPRVTLPITNQAWVTPFPGFKIVGNVYICRLPARVRDCLK